MSAGVRLLPETLGLQDISDNGPPVAMEGGAVWRITRHADCLAALRHPAVQTIDIAEELQQLQSARAVSLPSLANLLGGVLIARRAPYHPKARAYLMALQTRSFSPEAQRRLAEQILSEAPHGEPVDLVPLLNQLSLQLLALNIGIDAPTLHRLDQMMNAVMLKWAKGTRVISLPHLDKEAARVNGVLLDAIASAKHSGDGPLHNALRLGTTEYGMDEEEICGLIMFLILASVETTAGFMSNMALLLQHFPAVACAARAAERPRARLIEEALRLAGPVRRLGRRIAMDDVELGGGKIAAGSMLLLDIEAANRDPLVYPDPWCFDPARNGPPSLAFSTGAHSCIGGKTARQLAAQVLDVLITYEIVPATPEAPEWIVHPGFRIPRALPSVLTPHAG
ncbi:cytochrome P450 [Ancylobacter sonchi]|uniref:cytochrome P450 n=1 Tax=Ancylobacter sonchi TaxID=1937790 RepID=UPI001BD36C91|nr:cytochrome P450 [Ancylobacter sonchi]MBS7534934.1 cytochrome P450 [Ancylobacter sonchi]